MASASRFSRMPPEVLGEWCLAIVILERRMFARTPLELESVERLEAVVRTTVAAGKPSRIRALAKELALMAREMPEESYDVLDRELVARFGFGLRGSQAENDQRRQIVMRRGAIRNPTEFRLLTEHADRIYADPSRREELDQLNKLLTTYESGVARRRKR